jgi:hypothetical protein
VGSTDSELSSLRSMAGGRWMDFVSSLQQSQWLSFASIIIIIIIIINIINIINNINIIALGSGPLVCGTSLNLQHTPETTEVQGVSETARA